jgi:hypothetical protein
MKVGGHSLSDSELRAMIRDILREVVVARKATGNVTLTSAQQAVRINSDADLQSFIARLASPGAIEAVRLGTLRFVLDGSQTSVTAKASDGLSERAHAVLNGVVSERKLSGFTTGQHVVLAPGAVLTPLAKDLARQMGLKFERTG